jgi:hypothetical protein
MNSRDTPPLSPSALAIIAILVLVLHVASSDRLDYPHADPATVAPGGEATCMADTKPPELSLPYD